ncbi:MAG: threonine-phosphate decarboxylase CobD [Tahibacter sp.]
MLEHGGRLRRAVAAYAIPREHWLDLSTGINPNGWPLPAIPREVWKRLPEDDDELEAIAARCYGAPKLLAVAGTQAAIRALARLRTPCRVGVIEPGYAEHAHAWELAGHCVERLPAARLFADPMRFDIVVLIHPNNPGAERFTRNDLLALHAQLRAHDGWLIVDEAFMDATPQASIVDATDSAGLIVLRSPGKFFGIAGARIGFVAVTTALLEPLRETLGPWCVAGPTRWLMCQALADENWQTQTRAQLHLASERLHKLLSEHGLTPSGSTTLFQWVQTTIAQEVHKALARSAILTRLFDAPVSLRFGLPGTEREWQRLEQALGHLPNHRPRESA